MSSLGRKDLLQRPLRAFHGQRPGSCAEGPTPDCGGADSHRRERHPQLAALLDEAETDVLGRRLTMSVDHEALQAMLSRLKLTAIRDQFDSLLDEAARKKITLREAPGLRVRTRGRQEGRAAHRDGDEDRPFPDGA